MSSSVPTTSKTKRPAGLRRWTLRILAALVALLILIFIIGEIIFSTDLPRNLVVNAIEKQLGLRIKVNSLSTGWLGDTRLHDVAISLPLSGKAFLSVPTLEIKHSPLPWLILTGSISVHDISIDHAQLEVVEDAGGNWNLQQVAQLLGRTGGSQNTSGNSDASSNNSIPQLPRLDVRDATLVVTDNQHRSATIANLSLTGRSDGPLVWNYQAVVPDHLEITGKVAVGGLWNHQLDLNLHDVKGWMSPWIKNWPEAAHFGAHWSGQAANGQVTGRLDVEDAEYGSSKIQGPVEITAGSDQTILQPVGLLLMDSHSSRLAAYFDGGQILFDGADIESKSLSIESAGGRASVDGKIILADGTSDLHAVWRDIGMPESVRQAGDLSVDYTPSLGQPRFKATLNSQGVSKTFSWDSAFELDGIGNTLQTLSLSLTAQKLRFQSAREKAPIDLSGLVAQLSRTQEGLALTDLRLGNSNPVTGHGGYTFDSRTAWLTLDARGWPVPRTGPGGLNLDLNIWCNPTRVHLDQLFLNTGSLRFYGDGEYVYDLPKPVSAHFYFTESAAMASVEESPQSFNGDFSGNLDLNGTLKPVDLTVTGNAAGSDVHFNQRPFGDVEVALKGNVHDGVVSLASRNVKFLGGDWDISGQWPINNSLLRLDNLSVRHLSLPLALARDDVTGQLDGKWSVDIGQFNPNGIFVQGSAVVSNLAIGTSETDPASPLFAADEIKLPNMRLEQGEIDIKPIVLSRKVENHDGHATAALSTTLANPAELSVRLNASSWPIHPGSANTLLLLWGKGKLDVDLNKNAALGHLDLRADSSWGSHPVGRVDAALDFNRRRIDAKNIQIAALNGSATGKGEIDLDHPFQARANLDWKDVDLSSLRVFTSDTSDLSGKINGSLQIQPATVPRPLQPLAIALHISTDNVHWGTIGLGNAQAFAYVGPHRFVLDDDPVRSTQIAVAGGLVKFWGRVSRHPGDLYQSLVQVTLENLNLDALLPSGSKVAKTPGILDGSFTVVGRPKDPGLAFGEGRLTISQSDLAGTGPIAFLYNLMHLSHSAAKPQGNGTVDFRIQRESINIVSMRYFDRGAEVHAAGVINDFPKLSKSPVDITIVGSVQPLKSIDLPGVVDIDEALNALQKGAVTVRVTGPLGNTVTKKVLFSEISQDVKNLILGLVRSSDSSE